MAKKRGDKNIDKERTELVVRLVVLLVCSILFYFWNILIFVIFIINMVITLIKGAPNKNLIKFSQIWLSEITRALKYLLFISNERPFPFTELSTNKNV